jgi:cation transport ATPase
MISGDNEITAQAVARSVRIPSENVIAGVLPQQKVKVILRISMTVVAQTSFHRQKKSAGSNPYLQGM